MAVALRYCSITDVKAAMLYVGRAYHRLSTRNAEVAASRAFSLN